MLVEGREPVLIFLLHDRACPLLPFLMKEFSGGGINKRERFFSYKLPSAPIPIENAFGKCEIQVFATCCGC